MDSSVEQGRASRRWPVLRIDRYLPLIYMFAFAIVVAGVSSSGWLRPLSGPVTDFVVRHAPSLTLAESQVLIVEIERRGLSNATADQLTTHLVELGARVVAWNFVPPEAATEAVQFGVPVIYAAQAQRDAVTGEITGLRSATATGAGAVASLSPPLELGVARRSLPVRQVNGASVPAFEFAVHHAATMTRASAASTAIIVNYLDGGSRIPAVSLDRILAGDILRTLVEDRVVVIGHVQDTYEPGLHSPVTGSDRTTSLLRFQAQALDTLLRNDPIREPGFAALCLTLSVIILVSVFVYQTRGMRDSMWLTAGALALYFLLAWVALVYLRLALPLLEIVLVQVCVFFVSAVNKIIRSELVLQHALIESTSKTRDRIIPDSFYASEHPWTYVANLLSQTLELRRMIFLEKVEGDHRVYEVHALNCSMESIDERRRDYQRAPYSTAIALQAPLRLNKIYLVDDGSGDVQYLVCLSFAGRIIGFWAFGVMPEAIPDEANFRSLVHDFAIQVAEMLYHRQNWIAEQSASRLPLRRYLQLSLWMERVRAFREAQALIDQRLTTLEHVFNGMGTAAVLYDLFGRVVHVNRRMEELLREADQPFFTLTSVELVAALSGKDATTVRQYLHYVVIDRRVISLPARALDSALHSYLLHLRPLELDALESDPRADADDLPFRLSGVLIEIQDITMFKTLNDLQENLVHRLDLRLRNDLEALLLAVELLDDDEQAGEHSLKRVLRDKMHSTVASFEEIQKELNFTLDLTEIESYPIAYDAVLNRAVELASSQAARRKVSIEVRRPELSPLVIAGPDGLGEVFTAILGVLIEDAVEGSSLRVEITTERSNVKFEFSNHGFGIPVGRLTDYLHGHIDSSIDEFRRVRNAVRRVDRWGGIVVATSEIGEGIRFDLSLRAFM